MSRKQTSSLLTCSLCVNDSTLEQVTVYKYLGVSISSSLSWSSHINSVCSKVRKTSALIYRSFYQHTSPSVLIQLYKSLVLPYFCYCSSVWDPPPHSVDAALLEGAQRFARVCSKEWKTDSASLLSRHSISLLSDRRSIAKLSLLFKPIHNLIHSPFSPQTFKFKPTPKYSIRSYDSLTLSPRFCKIHSSSNSFVPSAIALWNSLPLRSSTSLQSFKSDLIFTYLTVNTKFLIISIHDNYCTLNNYL